MSCLSFLSLCSCLVASMFHDLFLTCVMRTFFFLVLMLAIDLIPLNSSRISCISQSFGSFVVSDSLVDLLADVSHLSLVFFCPYFLVFR